MIVEVLNECRVLIMLPTNSFKESNWTDQETGIALALGKTIVPVKIEIDPYGFVGKFQALKWSSSTPRQSLDELTKTLISRVLITKENLILGYSNSGSFFDAGRRSGFLIAATPFTEEEINSIISAAIANNQIYGSYDAKANLYALKRTHEKLVNPDRWARLVELMS